MRRAWIAAAGLALVLAGVPACEKLSKKDDTVEMAVTPSSMARLEARVDKVMSEPPAQKAMDEMFEAIASDPALGKLAGDLGDQLTADPVIAGAAEKLVGELGESPVLVAWMTRYMEQHPGMTPDQVGEAVGLEVEKKFEIMLQKPVEDGIGRLIERAEGGAGVAALQKHLSGQFDRVLDSYFEAPERKARWSKRLIELNGGTKPDPGRAADLYIDTAWSEERMMRFLLKACADPEVRKALVDVLRRTLAEPELRAHLVRATRTLAQDETLRTAVIDVFMLVFAEGVSPDVIDAKVRAMFDAPSVIAATNDLAQHLLAEKALHQILDGAIRDAARQPSVRAALDELCDGW